MYLTDDRRMIEIKRNASISKITELYYQLNEEELKEGKIDLLLPKTLDNEDFSVLFSLLQFFATWVRSSKSGNLRLPVMTESEYRDYLFQSFVYPAVVLSWEKEILDLNDINIRTKLKNISKDYFKAMEFFKLPENEAVPIFCFDHDLSKRGYSRIFYEIEDKVVPESMLDFALHPAFVKIGHHLNRKVFNESMREKLSAFYGIIHELFNNTDEHARTDERGHNLYPNIRSLYLKFHRKPQQKYLEIYKDNKGLNSYFSSNFKVNENNEIYLIEISVLDSGPGLVKRYEGVSELKMSVNEEVLSIKKCLYGGNTSLKGIDKDRRGIGLDRVLHTLDDKGFVRIKTGRVDVFRDMKSIRYHKHSSPEEIQLFDWIENSNQNFTVYPEATGTLISIIYPLDYK